MLARRCRQAGSNISCELSMSRARLMVAAVAPSSQIATDFDTPLTDRQNSGGDAWSAEGCVARANDT